MNKLIMIGVLLAVTSYGTELKYLEFIGTNRVKIVADTMKGGKKDTAKYHLMHGTNLMSKVWKDTGLIIDSKHSVITNVITSDVGFYKLVEDNEDCQGNQ